MVINLYPSTNYYTLKLLCMKDWTFVQKLRLNPMNQFVAHLHHLLIDNELNGGRAEAECWTEL